ncbi:MAG: hypothetical protein IPL50_08220 [Chitinophagaceae bacterium]|nr:hypothetical protein [Chitinophagaceae bacterium]
MKFSILTVSVFAAFLFFAGCKKLEETNPGGVSVGTLKDTATGACLPVTVHGIFIVDSVLTSEHYVDIQADVVIGGTFEIKSDTINGYSFNKTGTVGTGLNVIRLYASGKPLAAGINVFTITYGLNSCTFAITVYTGGSGSGTALYTLGGAPGNCSVSSISGNYVVGQAMNPANLVEMTVNVTGTGTYIISGPVINGVSFGVSGVFTNPGIQNIFLAATGTPLAAGLFNYPVTNTTTTCNFPITYTVTITNANYTLSGSPGICTSAALTGTYTAGTPLNASNTAVINVTVTSPGIYTITTPTVNGISFSATGTFNITGTQQVILNGTGTPAVAGTFGFPLTGGGNTCNFSVTCN